MNADMLKNFFTILSFTALAFGLLVSCSETEPDSSLPSGALSGEFSVSATKKVHFSKGNLYWDGDSFEFEQNQYDVQESWNTSHVSHFYWSKTDSIAYARTYSIVGAALYDVFFTNDTPETAKGDFVVNGVKGKFCTLSTNEWRYLFNRYNRYGENCRSGNYKYCVTVCGVNNCVVLLPDNWQWDGGDVGNGWQNEYSEETTVKWSAMESAGAVCLPAAGFRDGPDVYGVGNFGYYYASSSMGENIAHHIDFNSSDVRPAESDYRNRGFSVRLVTESKESFLD